MSIVLRSDRYTGYVYLTFAMITVGSAIIASKVIGQELPPFTATAIRFAFALPIFHILVLANNIGWPKMSARDFSLLVLQALAGSVGYSTLLIFGLTMTSASDASVIVGTLPTVVALVAIIVLREMPGLRLIMAITLATAGVLAVSWQHGSTSNGSLLGNVLIVCAVVCEGFFALLNKRLSTPIAPLLLSTIIADISIVAATSAAFAFESPLAAMPSGRTLSILAYYAVVPTVLGFILWYSGSARVTGSEASLFTAVAPVSAVLMAGTLLGEPITGSHVVGIICVLLAVAAVTLAPRGSGRAADAKQSRPS
jgi:drug/metabolite transporter (DMT)-like permease